MPAQPLDLLIEQGATFSVAIPIGSAYDGHTAVATVRSDYSTSSTLVSTLTCSAVSGGSVTVSLTATQTAAMAVPVYARPDTQDVIVGWWSLETSNAGVVTRHRTGVVTLRRGDA